jgi:hypothetical protein
LSWLATLPTQSMTLTNSFMGFASASSSLLRCPYLVLNNTRIEARGGAACSLQFDAVAPSPANAQFVIGAGGGTMQFDAYTEGGLPFDFLNKSYPQALFNFNTSSPNSGGGFTIRVASRSAATTLVAKGLIGIDNHPQFDESQLNVAYDAGFATVTLKR